MFVLRAGEFEHTLHACFVLVLEVHVYAVSALQALP